MGDRNFGEERNLVDERIQEKLTGLRYIVREIKSQKTTKHTTKYLFRRKKLRNTWQKEANNDTHGWFDK